VFSQYSFLYVEDDPLSREIMQMIVQNAMGARCLTMFEDSTDLITRLKTVEPKPDVILLDIHVQPLNGFAMLRALRAEPAYSQSKVVALTASVMNEEVEQLRQAGFDGAIGKPLSVQSFPELIARIIKGDVIWHIA
jgi:CheY-like chemotaxis protein